MIPSSGKKALLDKAREDSISYFTCAHTGQMGVCEGCLGEFTNEAVSAAVRERDELIKKMWAGIESVTTLMQESRGVSGLHMNGDEAPWSELSTGGRFEHWLMELDDAVKAYDSWKEKVSSQEPPR